MPRTLPRAWTLAASLLVATSALAQDPAALVQAVLTAPDSPEAIDATLALASSQNPPEALAAIRTAWDKRPPSGVAAARLAGASVALGADHLDEAVRLLLLESPDAEKLAVLSPLARARVSRPKIAAAVAALRDDPSPDIQAAARLAHDHLGALGRSHSILFFVGLLLLAAGGAVWHFSSGIDENAITTDSLVGFVDEWTNKPRERTELLGRIREKVEGPEARFLGLFQAEVRLTSNQVTSLLDLLSHFDVDSVHEKLYEFATHQDDELRKAAILAMHRLGDEAWVGVLADFVRGEDEVARYAGATALARRGSVDQLPLLREEMERTRLGSVRDGIREAIEKLESLS